MIDAITRDDLPAITKLLADGISPDAVNGKYAQPILCTSVAWGSDAIARALINAKACVNSPNAFGLSPLHTAAMHSRMDLAKLCLQSGADAKARAGEMHGSLFPYEMAQGDELRTLLESACHSNPVHEAVDAFDFGTLTSLLEQGASIQWNADPATGRFAQPSNSGGRGGAGGGGAARGGAGGGRAPPAGWEEYDRELWESGSDGRPRGLSLTRGGK